MKKFIFVSLILAGAIILFLVSSVSSQKIDDSVTNFHLSLTDESNGNYSGAINKLLLLYEQNKTNYLYNLRLGWLYYNSGNYTESIDYYLKAVDIKNNKSIEPFLGLTLPYSALENWTEVENIYKTILGIDSKHFTANLRLGQIFLSRAEYEKAKQYLEVAQMLYTSEFEPNLSLGWTYFYLGDKLKAKELLTNALMLSPDNELALEGLKLVK